MITAIIMASGLSKRMGENKLLLEFEGVPIIEHTFKEIKKSNIKEVIVISQYNEIISLSKKYKFKCIYNDNAAIGQSESIKLGIINSSKCDGYMFFVGDQPLIDSFYIDKIMNEFNKDNEFIIIPKYNNKKGNPVIFPYKKREDLLNLQKDEKGKKVVNNYDKIKFVQVSESMLIDIDNKEDYKRLTRRVK